EAGAARAAGATHGLAVDGDVAEAQLAADGVDPAREAVLEGAGRQCGEDAVEGVVGGDAVGQTQAEGTQPRLLGAAELGDVVPGVAAGQHGGQGDDQDVLQQVVVSEGGVPGGWQGREVGGGVPRGVGGGR